MPLCSASRGQGFPGLNGSPYGEKPIHRPVEEYRYATDGFRVQRGGGVMGEACTALSHPFPTPRLARRMSYPALRVPGGSRGDPMIRGDQGGPPDNHRQGGRGFPEPPGPVASPPNNQSYVHPKRGVNLFCKRDHITIGYLGGVLLGPGVP